MENEIDINLEDDDFDRLLDDFINNELKDIEAEAQDNAEREANAKPSSEKIIMQSKANDIAIEDSFAANLYPEEKALFEAFCNFRSAITMMCREAGIEVPAAEFSAESIYPRFKPRCCALISNDIVTGWNIMLLTNPERMENIDPNADDETILNFAEKTTDEFLQLALISYIEILIEAEGCEIAYDARRAAYERRKVEREVLKSIKGAKNAQKNILTRLKKKNFP